jgi:hypothetical protein
MSMTLEHYDLQKVHFKIDSVSISSINSSIFLLSYKQQLLNLQTTQNCPLENRKKLFKFFTTQLTFPSIKLASLIKRLKVCKVIKSSAWKLNEKLKKMNADEQ